LALDLYMPWHLQLESTYRDDPSHGTAVWN
jgi:hypothetical protein